MRIALFTTSTTDDNRSVIDIVRDCLLSANYRCDVLLSADDLKQRLRKERIDMLIVDASVSRQASIDVLQWVRQRLSERLPVVFVTDVAHEADISSTLHLGADDHVVMPVAPELLLARVRSLLRRAHRHASPTPCEVFGDYRFDPGSKRLMLAGVEVALTPKEFDLALLFFRNPGHPMSRVELLDLIWNQESSNRSRSMDAHICMLRSKLKLRGANGYRLNSIYRYGYCLDVVKSAVSVDFSV